MSIQNKFQIDKKTDWFFSYHMTHQDFTKAEKTKSYIIERAAPIFNKKGYTGTSISDIMRITGLSKGCIYGNFKNKNEIAVAALEYNMKKIFNNIYKTVMQHENSLDRLRELLRCHKGLYYNDALKAGCPILNAAIDVDDTNQYVFKKVKYGVDSWRKFLCKIIEEGRRKGEIRKDVASDEFATNMIALIEGGSMLFSMYKDIKYIERVFSLLERIIANELT